MEDAPVVVFESQDEKEARVVEGLLRAHDIFCYLTSHITHDVYPITVDGLGLTKVLVSPAKAEEARQIIEDHQEEGD
jgi:hypothetical protein